MFDALAQARCASGLGEVPVGAVVVFDGAVVARGHNICESHKSSLAHAELLVIEAAQAYFRSKYLFGCDIYVTLEPCAMCAHAIRLARVRRLYFGAYDHKCGAIDHGPRLFYEHGRGFFATEVIGGVMERECSLILSEFFASVRLEKR